MAALSTARSIPQLQEALFGVGGSATLPVKGVFKAAATATTPTQAAANTAATATVTVTGVALGDGVVVAAPTTALPAGQVLTGAYVTAADTVTLVFNSTAATTGASRTFNVVVLDLT